MNESSSNILFTEQDFANTKSADKSLIGQKACGIFMIPKHWRPPLAVIKTNFYMEWAAQNSQISAENLQKVAAGNIIQVAQEWAEAWPRGIILRSSAVNETLKDRGSYLSCELPADYNTESVGEAVKTVFESFRKAGTEGGFAIAIQPLAPKGKLGHCSNERRVSKTVNQWEWAFEDSPVNSRYNSQRSFIPKLEDPLSIARQNDLVKRLRSVGRWCTSLNKGPAHLEWSCTEDKLWLLQLDFEDDSPDEGVNPRDLIRDADIFPAGETSASSYIRTAQVDGTSGWGKLDVVKEFVAVRPDPYPKLFTIRGNEVTAALKQKETLESDLKALMHDRGVCRTACKNSTFKHNLPRTDSISATSAVSFLSEQLEDLVNKGLAEEEICFIMHKFIPARAAAWASADPTNSIVRIDSLWGVPDGLQYYPHDSFQVSTKLNEVVSRRIRYKPFFIQEIENGEWKQIEVSRRYVRSQSLYTRDLLEIAQQTHQLASNAKRAKQVMWFCDISENAGIGRNLPWYMENLELPKSKERASIPKKKKFHIKDTDDLEKAKSLASDHILLIEPNVRFVRDVNFQNDIIHLAQTKNLSVEFLGSTLSHAYYAFQRAGIAVYPANEAKYERTRNKKSFFKLVRDDIPLKIRQGGENASLAKIPKSQSRIALIIKLFEEAMELKNAKAPNEVLAEIADILEVVRSLAAATGLEWLDIEEAALNKRKERGSFKDNVVLMETSWPSGNIQQENDLRMISLKDLATLDYTDEGVKCNFASLFEEKGLSAQLPSGTTINVTISTSGLYLKEESNESKMDQLDLFPNWEED